MPTTTKTLRLECDIQGTSVELTDDYYNSTYYDFYYDFYDPSSEVFKTTAASIEPELEVLLSLSEDVISANVSISVLTDYSF